MLPNVILRSVSLARCDIDFPSYFPSCFDGGNVWINFEKESVDCTWNARRSLNPL